MLALMMSHLTKNVTWTALPIMENSVACNKGCGKKEISFQSTSLFADATNSNNFPMLIIMMPHSAKNTSMTALPITKNAVKSNGAMATKKYFSIYPSFS